MKAPDRIAILGYYHGPKLGVGVFIDRFMSTLDQQGRDTEIIFYTNQNTLDKISGPIKHTNVRVSRLLGMGAVPAILFSAFLFPLVCRLNRVRKALILTNPIVVNSLVPTVSNICDVSEFDIDRKYGPIRTFYRKHIMLKSALKHSARLVAISGFVQKQLMQHFPRLSPDNITVVNPGVESHSPEPKASVSERIGGDNPYYLVVGRLDPKGKNLYKILDLFRLLEETNPGHRMIFAGGINDFSRHEAEQFLDYIDSDSFLRKRVTYAGYVSDSELASLYSQARATIFFSRVEGFGFPLIEAFRHGCPVIYNSDCEVLADHAENAGIGVSEAEPDRGELPDSIAQIFDPAQRDELRVAMNRVAVKYDWQSCVKGYMDVLEEARA